MSNKTEKLSLLKAVQLNLRAFKILNKKCTHMFLSSFICSVLAAGTPYLNIYLSALIINELAGKRNLETLWKLVVILLVSDAFLALLNALFSRWKNCKQATFWYNQNKIYADKMLKMDFDVLENSHTHELRSQIFQNQQWTGWGMVKILEYFEKIVDSFIKVIGAVALTVSLFTSQVPSTAGKLTVLNSPFFIAAFIAVMFLVSIFVPMCSNKANSYWIKQTETAKLGNRMFCFFGAMAQNLHRALDIRIYNQQNICEHNYNKMKKTMFSDIIKFAAGPMGALNALSAAITKVFTGVAYIYVCLKSWAGAFGIGSVTQYITSFTSLSEGISSFLGVIGDMRNNAPFLQTTFEFLDIQNNMYKGSLTTEKRTDRNYEIEFKDVSFKYPNTKEYALNHVSIKFKIGERLAVVGMNGSGKTTFIKLLCRLYDPTEGIILLNGINIRKYNLDDYISVFSVVFQDFKLLPFMLGQNVAAAQNYDKIKVEACLEKSGFIDKLCKMKDGTDTYLYKEFNENGVNISGGEAQKIAIARALYKEASFIILDEPTAALDPIAEADIYSKFNEIIDDKTAIYISHRLSSCRFCDEIVVFDKGRIVQTGSHNQLVQDKNGKYFELWQAQAQYYQ